MTPVSQRTNYLRRQCFVQKLDHCLSVGAVALGHGAILDVLSRAFAQSLYISEKWFISHGLTPCSMNFGGATILAPSIGGRNLTL
jgi:hypothetical protein